MSHLSPERIAALADDTPTPMEAAHITACEACTSELVAYRRLGRMAAVTSGVFGSPSSRFDGLVPRLRAEGLIEAPDRRGFARRWTLRVAAAAGFVLVGAAAGRWSAGAAVPGLPPMTDAAAGYAPGSFGTTRDAMQAMMTAQETYQNAAAYLAAQDTTQRFVGLNTEAYRARLAALDDMAAASRAALYRVPQDPLLNQYYLAFQSARDQTLRQLAVSLPASRPLERY